MTNQEARHIFVLCRRLTGTATPHCGPPTDEDVKGALVYLADRAYKHLHAGLSGEKVRELWEAREVTPSSSDLVERLREQLDVVIGQASMQANEIREILHDEEGGEVLASLLEQSLQQLEDIADVRRCSSCGCTDVSPCGDEDSGPCGWVDDDTCTACVSP